MDGENLAQVCDFKATADLHRQDRRREPLISKDNNTILENDKDDKKKRFPTTPIKPVLHEKCGTANVKVCGSDQDAIPQLATRASRVLYWNSLCSCLCPNFDRGSQEVLGQSQPHTIAVAPPLRLPVVTYSTMLEEELKQAMTDMNMHVEKEYAFEIFSHMMQEQAAYSFQITDVPKRFTVGMRKILVNWLVQVHEYLSLREETLYLAIYLMNFYLKSSKIQIQKLQLLGATCLLLASKIEECVFPEPSQLCFMMENTFDKKALLKMEKKILTHLKFDLRYTHPLHFLWFLTTTGRCSIETRFLAMYFMELMLMEVEAVTFQPAELAAAGLCLALKVMQETEKLNSEEKWGGAFNLYTCSDADLCQIQYLMANAALRTPESETNATHLKYSRPQKLGVSIHPAMAASQHLSSLVHPGLSP